MLEEFNRVIAERDELRNKLKMVIAHATGGSEDISVDHGLNDICVAISVHHNTVYSRGIEQGKKKINAID